MGGAMPVYMVTAEQGEPHQPLFTVRVEALTHTSIASAGTKKEAKRQAAAGLLEILGPAAWADEVQAENPTGAGAGGRATPSAVRSSPRPPTETTTPAQQLELEIRKEESRHYFEKRQGEREYQRARKEKLEQLQEAKAAEEQRRRAEIHAINLENDRQAALRMEARARQQEREEAAQLERVRRDAARDTARLEEVTVQDEAGAPGAEHGEIVTLQQAGAGAGVRATPSAAQSSPRPQPEIAVNLTMFTTGLVGLRVTRQDGEFSVAAPAALAQGPGVLSITGRLEDVRELLSPDSAAGLRELLLQDLLPQPTPALTATTFLSVDRRFPPPQTGWNHAQHARFGLSGLNGGEVGAAGRGQGQWHHIQLNVRIIKPKF